MGDLISKVVAKPPLDPLRESARLTAGALQPTSPFMVDESRLEALHADRLRLCRKHRVPPHESEVIEAVLRHAHDGGRQHLERALAVITELIADEYEGNGATP